MKIIFNKIISIGVDQSLSSFEVKRVKTLNFCTLLLALTVVFFTFLDFVQGILSVGIALNFGLQILLLIAIFYFHFIKKRFWARSVFFILILFVLILQNNFLFRGFYGEYLYLIIPLLSIFFFNQKYLYYFSLGFSVLLFYVPNMILEIYPEQYFGYANTLFLFVGTFSIVLFFKDQNEKNEEKLKKVNEKLAKAYEELELSKDNELAASSLKTIKAQMNPHFIFNVINSIQGFILLEDTLQSYDSLVQFSKLVRSTLEFSEQEFILLEDELAFLTNYLSLEKLRFDEDFSYSIENNIEKEVKIPSLVIQPFIENAIKHGLLHKKGKKELKVIFQVENESLMCYIIDNGIGRKKSQFINDTKDDYHKSFSTNAVRKRLNILEDKTNQKCCFLLEDYFIGTEVSGTKVTVHLPLIFVY